MTREQIKKIVKLTESIVNKRLNESGKSFMQEFKDWITSQGLLVSVSKNKITVYDGSEKILEKTTNSFFRSDHLVSIANQVAKLVGIPMTFNKQPTSDDLQIAALEQDKKRMQDEFRSIMTSVFKFQNKYDVDIKVDSKMKTLRGLMDQIMGML